MYFYIAYNVVIFLNQGLTKFLDNKFSMRPTKNGSFQNFKNLKMGGKDIL